MHGHRANQAFGSFCLKGVSGSQFIVISKIFVQLQRPPIVVSAVVLISSVPAVVHTIAVKQLRQAPAHVPTGEGAEGTTDILCTSESEIFSNNEDAEEEWTRCHFLLSEQLINER